jgi:hypothetical protein
MVSDGSVKNGASKKNFFQTELWMTIARIFDKTMFARNGPLNNLHLFGSGGITSFRI